MGLKRVGGSHWRKSKKKVSGQRRCGFEPTLRFGKTDAKTKKTTVCGKRAFVSTEKIPKKIRRHRILWSPSSWEEGSNKSSWGGIVDGSI